MPTPTRVAAGASAIWVTSSSSNSVYRIDPESREVRQTIRVGDGPTGVAVAGGDVWVANTLNGTVSRIDAESNEVVGDPIAVGNSPTAVAAGEGSVWVTNADDRTVSRIDPSSGRVQATVDVGASGRGIAVGRGAAWVSDSASNLVARVDPKTNDVTQTIGVGSGPTAIAVGAGSVWVANTLDGTVSRIDPQTDQVRSTTPVGASPVSLVAAADTVWVANEADRSIARLDPETGQVADVVATAARPTGLALTTSLWVAAQAAEGAHRGGTLRVDMAQIGAERDPALAYDNGSWSILNITNDGLVGFKNVGGGEGADLVPDLATSLSTPTDGGTTYAFRLRKGIRYSTGARVKASDVRASFERLFEAGQIAAVYFPGLRGAPACIRRPKNCDLSSGIVTDDDAGTVTFHLTAPDAEFLYKLATPFGSVLPAGTPLSKGGKRPVPATGPYEIESESANRLRLVRNPHFRSWDTVARPAGYPDAIVVRLEPTSDRAAADVGQDRADVVTGLLFTPRVADMATLHPGQVHTTPAPTTFYWFLNTSRRPFADRRARQAVNYAVDRAELVRAVGGPQAAQPTCQVLPPNFPGYRAYCLYTVAPSEGGTSSVPTSPGRRLVRRSGTTGARVEFWMPETPNADATDVSCGRPSSRLASARRSTVRRLPRVLRGAPKARRRGPEAGAGGWAADYPAASTFFIAHLRSSRRPGSGELRTFLLGAVRPDVRQREGGAVRDRARQRGSGPTSTARQPTRRRGCLGRRRGTSTSSRNRSATSSITRSLAYCWISSGSGDRRPPPPSREDDPAADQHTADDLKRRDRLREQHEREDRGDERLEFPDEGRPRRPDAVDRP